MRHTLAALLCCAATASAQTFPVSPNYDKVDAQGSDQLAGLGATFRQQILISSNRLAGLKGKDLTGIAFRRDAAIGDALTGGSITLAISLSRGPVDPGRASQRFAANQLTKPLAVFNGTVTIPNSPAVSTINYDPWGSTNAFQANFTTTYRYNGEALCIDLLGIHSPKSGTPFWLVDFEQNNADGKVETIGNGCVDKKGFRAMAYAPTESLRVGSTLQITSLGRSGTTALFLLGVKHYSPGLTLASMGAPDCSQYVQPMVILSSLNYIDFPYPTSHAIVNVIGKIPVAQGLMGSRLIVQFANNEAMLPRSQWANAAGMTTSNGLALTISSVPPNLGMSMVRSYAVPTTSATPAWGAVNVSKAPVIRFTYK